MDPEQAHNIMLAVSALLAVMAGVQIWRAADLLLNGVRTDGKVTRHSTVEREHWKGEGQGSETVRLDFPHVEFSLPDGSRVEFKSRLQKMTDKGLDPGTTVAVLYNPKAPAKTAEIDGARTWLALGVRVVPTAVFALALLYYGAQGKGWIHF